jgi:hypothetical protein
LPPLAAPVGAASSPRHCARLAISVNPSRQEDPAQVSSPGTAPVRRQTAGVLSRDSSAYFLKFVRQMRTRSCPKFDAVAASSNSDADAFQKTLARTTASLRFNLEPFGSTEDARLCHADAATHHVNGVAGIRELQLILAADWPDTQRAVRL